MSLKIKSSFIIAKILYYFPLIKRLKIVKYSKKYQMIMNLSILNYQINFLYYMLKKEKNYEFAKEKGEIINDKEIDENNKKDNLIYDSLWKKLNQDNSIILMNDNFDEKCKNLKSGDSIKIIINLFSDLNTIEQRMKLLLKKNIIIKEIEYYHKKEEQFEAQLSEWESGEDEDEDEEKDVKKYFIDKLVVDEDRDQIFYIKGDLEGEFTLLNNKFNYLEDLEVNYNKINIYMPKKLYNNSKFFPLEYIKKNNSYLDLEHVRKNIIDFDFCVILNYMDCHKDFYMSYKYIDVMSLDNLIELNIEIKKMVLTHFNEKNEESFVSTAPHKLPNLKKLKCVNIFPNFFDLKNIVNIIYIVDEFHHKIECDQFEEEFPFIIAFFRKEFKLRDKYYSIGKFNFLLKGFEDENIHINLKNVYLSDDSGITYERNFEKNKIKIKIEEWDLDDLYNDKLKIPHYISDKYCSIKIGIKEKCYYVHHREEAHSWCLTYTYTTSEKQEFKKENLFLLEIEEDVLSKNKEIYFPFLPYKNIIENNTIRIHSYETLEKISLYVYHFYIVYSELFCDNDIKLINLRKVHLCFGKINIELFKTGIKNFLKKITNKISSIIILINNTYEYCEMIKKFIFSLPFIADNDKINNKIIIVKMGEYYYEEGRYEFKNINESYDDNEENDIESDYDNDYSEEFNEYDSYNDTYFENYKITEKTRMKKNRKKVIRHHSIKELIKKNLKISTN